MPRSPSLSYRIIGIEWTVKNGKPFQLSPKKPRKHRTKKSKRATSKRGSSRASGSGGPDAAAALDGSHPHLDASAAAAPTHSEQSPKKLVGTAKGKGKEKENRDCSADARLTADASNANRSPKRHAADMLDDDDDALETPPKSKRGRVSAQPEATADDDDWEQWEPPVLTRKSRRRLIVDA